MDDCELKALISRSKLDHPIGWMFAEFFNDLGQLLFSLCLTLPVWVQSLGVSPHSAWVVCAYLASLGLSVMVLADMRFPFEPTLIRTGRAVTASVALLGLMSLVGILGETFALVLGATCSLVWTLVLRLTYR